MGYNSRVTGRISIVPAIPMDRLVDCDYIQLEVSPLRFEAIETRQKTANGTLINESLTAIVPASDDRIKADKLTDYLAEMAAAVLQLGSLCVGGWIVRSGEEQGDVERYTVGASDQVVTETAELRWPDGTAAAQ